MVAVPFLYFSALLLYIIKTKKTFDISAYLVSLYLVSSFFSILIDVNNLRSFDTIDYEIGIVPTVLYCFLLTLTIWPFYRFQSERIVSIRLNKPKLFDKVVYFYFACFLFLAVFSFNTILKILNGDLSELRDSLARGDSITDIATTDGVFHTLVVVVNVFGGFSIIMLLFYFYSISFLKRSKAFNTMVLLSSMTIIMIGILGVDRSKTVYWIITYGFMLVMFWRHMTKKQHKSIIIVSATLFSLVLSYFIILTISRFGESDSGSEGGMISYAGQSFINFCFFFDNVNYQEFSLQRIFPLFYKLFIDNGIESTADLNADISARTGYSIAVFSTFVGDMIVASGKLAGIAFCVVFSIITRRMTNFKSGNQLYFYQLLILFCLSTVPMLGLFAHFYNSFDRVITLYFFLIYALSLKFNLIRTSR